ncbi:MAG: hypothetical protein ACD_41C00315G0005 [uncultured bacterium]|nr:MAG: hypothetical protein ACD_41C00315G0005 [uncultured bacterium]HBY74073.1 hypothetical protein [Candidatus Kerfeldbacteria bacterium]
MSLHHYYESLNDQQRAFFRWCASQLFKDDLQEMEAQDLYGDDFEKLSDILQRNVVLELEKLSSVGPCDANLLDGIFECIEERGHIENVADLIGELSIAMPDATELSARLRVAFPDDFEEIALEAQRRHAAADRPEPRLTQRRKLR